MRVPRGLIRTNCFFSLKKGSRLDGRGGLPIRTLSVVVSGDGLPLPGPELGRADNEANPAPSDGTRASCRSSMLHVVKISRLLFHAFSQSCIVTTRSPCCRVDESCVRQHLRLSRHSFCLANMRPSLIILHPSCRTMRTRLAVMCSRRSRVM